MHWQRPLAAAADDETAARSKRLQQLQTKTWESVLLPRARLLLLPPPQPLLLHRLSQLLLPPPCAEAVVLPRLSRFDPRRSKP
jgi:hypothetical protein